MKRSLSQLMFLLPALLAVSAVVIAPFLYNVGISLTNMNLTHVRDFRFVGFAHYQAIIGDSYLLKILGKTLLWTAINLFFHVGIGVMLALFLDRPLPGRGMFRAIFILPWAIPQYICALTWRSMFHSEFGAINLLLQQFSVAPVQWLSEPQAAFVAAIIANVWLGFPFMMITALAGLQSIPRELYEAAAIDGASPFSRFRHIILPMLKPVLAPAVVLGTVWTFNNFNVIWLVTNGGEPSDQSHILVSYVYKAVFTFYRYGYAAALSLVIFAALLTLSLVYFSRMEEARRAP